MRNEYGSRRSCAVPCPVGGNRGYLIVPAVPVVAPAPCLEPYHASEAGHCEIVDAVLVGDRDPGRRRTGKPVSRTAADEYVDQLVIGRPEDGRGGRETED